MPIRAEFKWLYPLDWPQLSAMIRFERAKGRCEACGRPHGQQVHHLGDGRWWDEASRVWRSGRGRPLPRLTLIADGSEARITKVVLATAHLDHDPSNSRPKNLKALCVGEPGARAEIDVARGRRPSASRVLWASNSTCQ